LILKPGVTAEGNYNFAIVALEYFIKWVEAKPVTNITSATIKKNLGKTLFVVMESHSKSQLTTPSILTVTCSWISATKLEQRLPSHQYIIHNQTEQ
jgi:hypothetical protein